MTSPGYDIVARVCMISSLLLFVAFFLIVIVYVVRFTKPETLKRMQAEALDLAQPDRNGARS